jgi:DNA-binding transcriptional ArsR family regulator
MYPRDSMSWDPLQLRLDEGAIKRSRSDPPQGRRTLSIEGRFIAGPIEAAWVIQAGQLGVKALLLGMVLWHLKGLRKFHTFKVSNMMVREWGITPDAKSRGLRKLERAGLIAVQRQGKRSPQVTLKRTNEARVSK